MNEVYQKEINSGKTELAVNETVKKKAKAFIKKSMQAYMSSKGFKVTSSPTSDAAHCNDQDSQHTDAGSQDESSNVISDAC